MLLDVNTQTSLRSFVFAHYVRLNVRRVVVIGLRPRFIRYT